MAEVILYIAASLDGYIATSDDGLDWLSLVERPGEDYGYAAFTSTIDALIMGSRTFELVRTFDPWPYAGKLTFVCTSRRLQTDRKDVAFLSGEADRILEQVLSRGPKRIWLVGGGELVSSFQRQGLIDEYIISFIPVILGGGKPLFPPPGREERLELVSVKHFPSGLVQVRYRRRIAD